MKVKLKTSFVSDAGDFTPGQEMELFDTEGADGKTLSALDQAKRLIALGYAEAVPEFPITMKADELKARRRSRVEVATIIHDEEGMETACLVRRAQKWKPNARPKGYRKDAGGNYVPEIESRVRQREHETEAEFIEA